MSKKTFFIIPGFKQRVSSEPFAWLVKFLKQRGFEVVEVPVTWDRHTNTECAKDFQDFYRKRKSKKNYILGFSYGAVIAFISATVLRPEKLYLCSLSPDFREDLSYMKPWIKKDLGKKRIADVKQRSGRGIAKMLRMPITIFYGEKEARRYPALKIRCEETAQLAKDARVVIIKNAPHDIHYPSYEAAIKKEIRA